jgi:hypothetical protein
MNTERSRQIHLDFHTSELIPDIGSRFSKAQFQEALKVGRVNLINVFAKCHHGWSYYPTRVGKPHPNLKLDLLGAQIEACHEIDVVAPIYYTIGWSANDAEEHPQWCMRDADGRYVARDWSDDARPLDPKPGVQWKTLCVRGAYHDLVRAQTEEICAAYPVDGFWYDIYHAHQPCYCDTCRRAMKAEGVDVADPARVEAFRAASIRRHCADLASVIRGRHPEASIYFNGLTSLDRPQNFRYRLHEFNTKNDLEDLPTTWGGYDKLPLRARIFHQENKPVVAMSGKFHTSWGEFGGFKHPEAIRFEAASMIANGVCCNFGDQLHPSGVMDMSTYRNVGHAYAYVEQIEEYGIGARPEASLGLWACHELAADEGVARMLLEAHIDFDAAAPGVDLSRFQTIIVPSRAGAIAGARRELEAYLAGGGTLFALGAGILDESGGQPVIDCGAAYTGPGLFDMDYTVAAARLRGNAELFVPESPFLSYESAHRFAPRAGCETLAAVQEPYFSRTYGAYCGHLNTPNKPVAAAHPAAFKSGRVIVAAHALDRLYYQHGARVHRDYFVALLRMLHDRPMVEAAMPSAGRVSLLHQPAHHRYVAHLLYGSPMQRGRCLVIEDLPPLRDTVVRLRLPREVRALRLVPAGSELPMRRVGDVVETTVPEFAAHCAVVAIY